MAVWNKVWALEGDPFFIDCMIKDIQSELGNPDISRYSNTSNIEDIKLKLTAFSFFDVSDLVIISEPNADILKMCLELTENNFSASGLIVTCEHNTFDSRLSFISKASKNKRLDSFSSLQEDDIKIHIKEWADYCKVDLSPDCYNWFSSNAPTIMSKIKTPNGKKDVIVYDLISLEKFLDKLKVVYLSDGEQITVSDLGKYSNFNREADNWIFIENVMSGKLDAIYHYFEKQPLTQSNHSILWLLLSQLEFFIEVKHYMHKGLNQTSISENLSMKNILGYYLDDNMEEIQGIKAKPSINPYRLQMAMKTCTGITMNDLISKYQATISAIRDLRSGLYPGLVSYKLSFAYSNKNKYEEPFYDV